MENQAGGFLVEAAALQVEVGPAVVEAGQFVKGAHRGLLK